jgi:hypothetical protein
MLTVLEMMVYKILKLRYQQIVTIKEKIWRQRAKRQWVKEGDKNSSYFHTVATIQKRQNVIQSLKLNQEENEYNYHKGKAERYFINSLVSGLIFKNQNF